MSPQIEIDPAIAERARRSVERMTAIGRDAQ
jgi:quinolinate synthase